MKVALVALTIFGLAVARPPVEGEIKDASPTKPSCYCPQQFYLGESGTIQSPNYPGNYCNSIKCVYTITARDGYYLKLQFTAFNTEPKYDTVSVYDSNKADDPYNQMASFSGPSLPPQALVSGTNQITVVFQSDQGTTFSGFSASWTSVSNICGTGSINIPSGGSGTFHSPDWGYKYPDNVDCTWTITAPSSQRIRLAFDHSSETESESDFVTVTYDGRRVSFSGTNFQTIETIGNTMSVQFTSDDTVIKRGFSATYTAFTPNQDCSCGSSQRIITVPNGEMTVSSPNFDHGGSSHNYCNNANCTWYLQVPSGYKVSITFPEFDLERGYDNVYLYEGVFGNRIRTCTSSYCPNVTAAASQMTMQFVTDISVSGQGFTSTFFPTI